MTSAPPSQPTSAPTTDTSAAPQPNAAPAPAPALTQPEAPTALTADAFQLPKGFELDNDAMSAFLGVLNNKDLSGAKLGQALIDLQANLATKASEAGSQRWTEQQQTWQTEIQNDKDLGGANLPKTVANIGRVMDKFGTPELRNWMNETGLGNHPMLIRLFNSLGAQFGEGTALPPGGSTSGGAERTHAQRIFGNNP